MDTTLLSEFALRGIKLLRENDRTLFDLLERESRRQSNTLAMVAASSVADPSVLVCEGTAVMNVTTEGYPGARFHAGCELVDEIERLAIERAKAAFSARYANVQPHSGSSANEIVMFSLLRPGDTILGLDLDCGGHLTHGSKASISGQFFRAIGYGLTPEGFIDYDQAARLAEEHKPKLIVCGASSYPRTIDFKKFREIADRVGAFLLADISHIAGLVVGGEHPSPIDHAHFTTTSTYKQLFGPRGGLILMGKDHDQPAPNSKRTLAEALQKAVFPFMQGTPHLNTIAAKARALDMVTSAEFKTVTQRIVTGAKALAASLSGLGYHVLTGGTDNHIVLINVLKSGVTGVIAERALEECDIIVNKNRIAGDQHPPLITSGMRLGNNSLALRGMGAAEMPGCADLIHQVIKSVKPLGTTKYELPENVKLAVRAKVSEYCRAFPLPNYPEDCSEAQAFARRA
ncbi:MAG: serine hydroxymethyltransferase [Verrucomicrobia bacterium]|nr:serine hydroxymethyltransferase [Verrucomicrobiota bacterium]